MFTIYSDSGSDSTMVSNLFIDEYMKSANDAQIKVYLYLLRVMGARRPTSVSDMADRFNHTEKDVLRSLRYWEQKGLLNLTFDKKEDLVSICLCRPKCAEGSPAAGGHRVLAFPPSGELHQPENAVQFLPDLRRQAAGENMPAALYRQGDLREARENTAGSSSGAADSPEPVSELEALESFRADPGRASLLFVVEQYIGKPLSLNEIRIIWQISQKLHFSDELLDYLIQYCVDRGKKDFRYIRKVAENWTSLGIMTPAQAESAPEQPDGGRRKSFSGRKSSGRGSAGQSSSPAKGNDNPGTASTASTPETDGGTDVSADGTGKPRRPRRGNTFNQFEQNSYDFDALEEELLQS